MATTKKAEFEIAHHHYLDDEMPARRVTVVQEEHGISLHIEGCGQKTMEPGYEDVVFIELNDRGAPVVHVWGDINSDDPTASIHMNRALEEHRATDTPDS